MTSDFSSQKTLKSTIHCSGVGLHSGQKVSMSLKPGEINTGIIFVRTDVTDGDRVVPASWDRVVDTVLCTVLANEQGVRVGTVEHLMAALRGCGVDNAVVELDGPEVPIMDGSAAPFVFLIECAGIVSQAAARSVIRLLKPVEIIEGDKFAGFTPASGFSFSLEIEFPSRIVSRQQGYFQLSKTAFKADIARARTFGFLDDVEHLRNRGLARGGSLENAIIVSGDRVLNEEGLRYKDEFVRHKILDSIGDLALAGAPIRGHFHGIKSGHGMNNRLLRALFADESAWCFDAMSAAEMPRYDARSPQLLTQPLARTA